MIALARRVPELVHSGGEVVSDIPIVSEEEHGTITAAGYPRFASI